MALDWNDKGTVDLEALTAFDVKCRCSNHRLLFLILKPLAFLNPWHAQSGFLVGLIKHHPNSQSEGSVDKRKSWTDLPPKSSSCGGVRWTLRLKVNPQSVGKALWLTATRLKVFTHCWDTGGTWVTLPGVSAQLSQEFRFSEQNSELQRCHSTGYWLGKEIWVPDPAPWNGGTKAALPTERLCPEKQLWGIHRFCFRETRTERDELGQCQMQGVPEITHQRSGTPGQQSPGADHSSQSA